jgi:hypothetical protein
MLFIGEGRGPALGGNGAQIRILLFVDSDSLT